MSASVLHDLGAIPASHGLLLLFILNHPAWPRLNAANAANSQLRMASSRVSPSRSFSASFWSAWCCWAAKIYLPAHVFGNPMDRVSRRIEFGMTYPSVSKEKAFGVLLLAGFLLAVGLATYFVMRPTPTEEATVNRQAGQAIGDANYEDLIKREWTKAEADTRRAQREHSASVQRLIAIHASQTASIADRAADRASEFAALTKTIYYLALDKAFDKKETDRHLQEHIGPIVEPGLQSLAKDVNADIASFDYEVRRITVQLATNIAANGPGVQPVPPRVVPPATIGDEFKRVKDGLGGKALGSGINIVQAVGTIPKSMFESCATIAGRLFSKQVSKASLRLPKVPLPPPIGIVVLVGSAIWAGYDAVHARTEYRDEVRTAIKKQLDDADHQIASGAVSYFSGRTADFLVLQMAITTKALEDIPKKAPK